MKLKSILKSNTDVNNEKNKNIIAENYSNFDDLEKRILSSISKIQMDGLESHGNNLLSLLFQLSYREQRPVEISKQLIVSEFTDTEFPFYFFNIANGDEGKSVFLSVNTEKLYETITDISNGVELHDIFDDAVLEKNIALKKTLPAEKNITNLLGIDSYKSFGQKFSLSQVANTQPGDCNIINLPTGSGKTLIGWYTHLSLKYSGISVLVLPTIGLEQDQYERAKTFFRKVSPETIVRVLYSATFDNQKNQVIKEIEDGSDLFLIVSPDYFENTEINKALKKSAKKGKLKNILIDEGHMIQEWGLDFRPVYLSMIFSVKILFEVSKSAKKELPKIFIFSGTFDKTGVEFFRKSFKFVERIIFFGSLFIRKEINPRIVKHNYPSFEHLIKELSFIMPKPAIIYTDRSTRKTDGSGTAISLFTNLSQNLELNFTDIFIGNSDSDQRKLVINNFSGKHCSKCFDRNTICIDHMYSLETSIVVATKAFGLGIDVDGIRSVIHIGLPQNIHEYYQQLGRGGRDGKSTLSVLFYNEGDLKDYKSYSHKILTWEKILPRWNKMFETNYKGDIKIDINAIPTELKDIPIQRKNNRPYNLATLNFLMLSDLIEKTYQPTDHTFKTIVDFNEKEWEQAINKQRDWLTETIYKKDIELAIQNPSEDLREMFADYYKFIFKDEMEQIIPRIEKDEVFEIFLKDRVKTDKISEIYQGNSFYFSTYSGLLEKIDIKFKELKTLNIYVNKNYQDIFEYDFKNLNVFVYEFDKFFEGSFQYKSTNLVNLIIYDQVLNFKDLPTGENIINLIKDNLINSRGEKLLDIKSLKYL